MRELLVYLLIGFFLNRFYNLVKRELWVWRQNRLRKKHSKPPPYNNCQLEPSPAYGYLCLLTFPECGYVGNDISCLKSVGDCYRKGNIQNFTWEMQGLPLPEGAEDFDLKGFMIDGVTGEVTGNWTQ